MLARLMNLLRFLAVVKSFERPRAVAGFPEKIHCQSREKGNSQLSV